MADDCAFCGALLADTPDRCPSCRRGQPVDSDGYEAEQPSLRPGHGPWFAPATTVPITLVLLGGVVWTFGFFRSFGSFDSLGDLRLVTSTMNVGLVLMLTGLFVVGLKAVRRLEKATEHST